MTDTGGKYDLTTDWEETENFSLPKDTKVVIIKGDNLHHEGGILASFSNGVVTDGTWQCADMSSCSNLECVNSVTWQDATTYGVNENNPPPWNKRLANIESTAQWIWAGNQHAKRVWCKKTFGKLIRIMHVFNNKIILTKL